MVRRLRNRTQVAKRNEPEPTYRYKNFSKSKGLFFTPQISLSAKL